MFTEYEQRHLRLVVLCSGDHRDLHVLAHSFPRRRSSDHRVINFLVPGREGNWTVHFPTGEVVSIYDAAMRYQAEGTPLVIITGKEYRSEEHTSELQSLMRISYAVVCLKKKSKKIDKATQLNNSTQDPLPFRDMLEQ